MDLALFNAKSDLVTKASVLEKVNLFIWSYCRLMSKSWLKHLTKFKWVSNIKFILLPWPKFNQILKLKFVFLRNLGPWNQISYKRLLEHENENSYKWVRSHSPWPLCNIGYSIDWCQSIKLHTIINKCIKWIYISYSSLHFKRCLI